MFKKLCICLVMVLFTTSAFAGGAQVKLGWSAAPVDTWGTKIYVGTEPGVYLNSEDAGIDTTVYTMQNLKYETVYYLTATHYEDGEESEFAAEITWTSGPKPPPITFNPLPEILETIKSYQFNLTISEVVSEIK